MSRYNVFALNDCELMAAQFIQRNEIDECFESEVSLKKQLLYIKVNLPKVSKIVQ